MKAPSILLVVVALPALAMNLDTLLKFYRSDPLLGLWDNGHFASTIMPEPVRIPDDQMVGLIRTERLSLQARPIEGRDLLSVLEWYGLDRRHRDETVKVNGLGDAAKVPAAPFYIGLPDEK
jgi:hypothetical protein